MLTQPQQHPRHRRASRYWWIFVCLWTFLNLGGWAVSVFWNAQTIRMFIILTTLIHAGVWLAGLLGCLGLYLQLCLKDSVRRDETRDLLRNSERFFLAHQAAGNGVWEWDLAAERIEFLPPNQTDTARNSWVVMPGLSALEARVHPEDLPGLQQDYQEFLDGKKGIWQSEFRLRDEYGQFQWLRIRACVAAWDARGRPTRIVGNSTDVSERKAAEIKKAQDEKQYRTLIENSSDVFLRFDRLGRLLFVSPSVRQILFRAPEDVIGKTLRDLGMEAELAGACDHAVAAVFVTGESGEQEFEIMSPGGVLYLNWRLFPEYDAGGRIETVLAVVRDVSDRKKSEEAYRNLFERMLDGFALHEMILDQVGRPVDYRFLAVNPAFERITGLSAEMVLGKTAREVIPDLEPEWVALLGGVALSGQGCRFAQFANGLKKYFEGVAFSSQYGQCACVFQDVSERMKLEEQLRQSQKMEAIGTLAGGIAHDFNNLLTCILGYANLLTLDAEPGGPVMEAALTIEKAAERAAELTRKLLGFARQGKYLILSVNVNGVIHEVMDLLGRTLDKKIEIRRQLCSEGANIKGDPGQIQQVIMNLVLNARDAMPGGGELVIATRLEHLDEEAGRQAGELPPGQYVALTVKDTGHGIPPEILNRIFEPFFTTKAAGKGTGMGLAMVYGIIKNHGGGVRVESEPGRGSSFTVFLPRHVDPALAASELSDQGKPLQQGKGRILLVDDEESVMNLARRMLEKLGYQVEAFSNGRAAVEYFQTHAPRIDLVILDMIMPEMDGRDVFLAMKAHSPGVRAILSSGYSRDSKAQEILDKGMSGFIQKPWHLAELSDAVLQALDGKALG